LDHHLASREGDRLAAHKLNFQQYFDVKAAQERLEQRFGLRVVK
jgi:hypothetical protein